MERLTRPTVNVDETAAQYMGKGLNMGTMNERLLELILNGPTLNAVPKDHLRHMIRKLYARLKLYEDTDVVPGKLNEIQNDAYDLGYQSCLNYKGMKWPEAEELQRYRDTGLMPEEVKDMAENAETRILTWFEAKYGFPVGKLMDLIEAEQEGRLVILDEPRLPLIWGDEDHDTILCPNCKRDLMGGFELADAMELPDGLRLIFRGNVYAAHYDPNLPKGVF